MRVFGGLNNSGIAKLGLMVVLLGMMVHVSSGADTFKLPTIQYEWGQMKRFHQILPDVSKSAHFNETKTFTFPFFGSHSTYNASVVNYTGDFVNPCKFNTRSIDLKFRKIDEGLGLPARHYLAFYQAGNKLFALTNTYKVFIFFSLAMPYQGLGLIPITVVDIPSALLKDVDANDKPIIMSSFGEEYIHIVFPQTMISLAVPLDYSEEKFKISVTSNPTYKPRAIITELIFAKGYLFVAAGSQGIDIYKITQFTGKIEFVLNMDQKFLNTHKELDVRDLALDLESRLYISDFNNGVIILKIQEYDIEKSIVLHKINILEHSNRIAVRGDHSLVVTGINHAADNQQRQYFVKELFFDIEKSDYFINRSFYDSSIMWDDIKMGDMFTFIQGPGHHRILYQGINKQLIPQADHHSDYRQGIAIHEKDHYEVKQIQNVQLGATNFIAISDGNIYSIELDEIPPHLSCSSDDERQIGEHSMRVVMNTTDCALAKTHIITEQNLWQMCQTDFMFKLTINTVWVDGSNVSIVGFVVTIVILSLIIIILAIFFLLQKYESRYVNATKELLDYKQKYSVLEDQGVQRANPYKDSSVIADKSGMGFNQEIQIEINNMK